MARALDVLEEFCSAIKFLSTHCTTFAIILKTTNVSPCFSLAPSSWPSSLHLHYLPWLPPGAPWQPGPLFSLVLELWPILL